MVDCADKDRIEEARQELHRIINDREMRDSIILVFANKQDLPDGMQCYILILSENFAIFQAKYKELNCCILFEYLETKYNQITVI